MTARRRLRTSPLEHPEVPSCGESRDTRAPVAWLPVGAVAATGTMLLLLFANGYGYHRDELYFRFLGDHPRWGYIDQPPLTPLIAKASTVLFGDSLVGLRTLPAIVLGSVAVLLALVAREVAGGRTAQFLATFGMLTPLPLMAGHALLTMTVDVLVWVLVMLFMLRALQRNPRYWLAAGATVGFGLYNKDLVLLLLIALGAGLLVTGPRSALRSRWLWAGVALAAVLGLPNLIYQIVNDFPQVQMAQAIESTKEDSRSLLLPMQAIALGPLLAPVWVAGMVAPFRDRALRPARALAVAYPLLVALILLAGGQPHYTIGLLLGLYAVGCVPTARWIRRRTRAVLLHAAVAVNVAFCAVYVLPVVPVTELAGTPLPEINQTIGDTIGWPTYVRQVADAVGAFSADERAHAVILAENYGEAGAIERFGGSYRLPPVYSGHNELVNFGPPPASMTNAVVLASRGSRRSANLSVAFTHCAAGGSLDNELGVETEEQNVDIWLCRGRTIAWAVIWAQLRHLAWAQ